MNWGKGIILGMALFMLFILSMCIYMFRMPRDEYDHHYYEKGLHFDRDYNREQQVFTDHATPKMVVQGDSLLLRFSEPAVGTASFIKPSSEALDQNRVFNTQGGKTVRLSRHALVKGHWKIVLEWQSSQRSYLYEEAIDLQ